MDSSKDIILALLSGSVSLAGLLLIFSGFLFSQAAGFDPDSTPDDIINAYRTAARLGVIPFLMCLLLAGVSLWWLRTPCDALFATCFYGFIALLVVTAAYGGYTILRYL